MTQHEIVVQPVTFGEAALDDLVARVRHGHVGLPRLEALAQLLRAVEELVPDEARWAFHRGHTWTEIGRALGVSKQAAWERYSGDQRR